MSLLPHEKVLTVARFNKNISKQGKLMLKMIEIIDDKIVGK